MNIIVTKNNVDYTGKFLKVNSLKEACQIVGTIDVLVYNNSIRSGEDELACLDELRARVHQFVYICNKEDTRPDIKMMIIGNKGRYFDDEFFLESSEELSNLVDSLDEVTAIANLGGVNVLSDFFNRYLKGGSSGINENYLVVVKEAVSEMVEQFTQKNLEIIRMSETATEIFSNTSSLLTSMKKEKENMQEIVEKMSNKLKEPGIVLPRSSSSVMFFPRVSYLKERSIIRIKEIGNFRFLMSCMIGFREYLENVKNLRPKLIVLCPVGGNIENKYKEFDWVTSSNSKSRINYYHDIVLTNCPSKEILETLLDDSDYDTFIVVDRTTSDKEHILNSKGGTVKYAISGLSCLTTFKLPKKDCITDMLEVPGTLCNIPMFPEYPQDEAARKRFYMAELGNVFEKLILDLRRR